MTNLAKTLNKEIKANIEGLKIYNDLFPKPEVEGVISIHDPTARKNIEFIDGTSEYQLNISYTARYKDAKQCREVLTSILDLLDNKKLIDNEDGLIIKINAVSNAQFIGTDDKLNSIYTCSFNATYRNI